MKGKVIAGIIGQGVEFSKQIPIKSKHDLELISKMKNIPEMQDIIPEKPEDYEYEIQEKPICLLIAHLHGLLKEYGIDNDP